NNAISPVAPPPKDVDTSAYAAVATFGEGGVCKLKNENTKITFVGSKPGKKHEGGFKSLEGSIKMTILTPGQTPPPGWARLSSIKVEIDTDSLYADDPKLTDHLKKPEFFDVKEFPKASFKSTKITGDVSKENEATATG